MAFLSASWLVITISFSARALAKKTTALYLLSKCLSSLDGLAKNQEQATSHTSAQATTSLAPTPSRSRVWKPDSLCSVHLTLENSEADQNCYNSVA